MMRKKLDLMYLTDEEKSIFFTVDLAGYRHMRGATMNIDDLEVQLSREDLEYLKKILTYILDM